MSVTLRGFLCLLLVFGMSSLANGQAWKTDVGFTKLQNEIGSGLETGVGVDALFVEAPNGNGDYRGNV